MKILSLLKASMSEGMNIFKVYTKKSNTFTKVYLPIILALVLMTSLASYSEELIVKLLPMNMGYVLLTIFIVMTSLMTFIEGFYKSSSLLFNCKDDNLLLSLPIKKSTVLFIRVFKFYIFELIFNSIFLIPSIAIYALHMHPGFNYYLVTFIGLFLFPIIPIILSSIFGSLITFLSSKFKGKNIVETIMIMIFLLAILYFSYGQDGIFTNIAKNATNINDFITRIYYPAGAYIKLITDFNILKLLEFIGINLSIFIAFAFILGRVYFKINSSVASIKVRRNKKEYTIKSASQMRALVKKELNKFVNSPVFISNAAFGLVLFIVGCIFAIIKVDSLTDSASRNAFTFDINMVIKKGMPVLLFGFIIFSSFMTSITSSMISLEGKSFSILKSLPVKPYTIVKSKVLSAVLVMIPILLIGSVAVFIKFKFSLLHIVLIIASIIVLPLLSETIGIIVNLKYPKMDAKNDTEVVKQSMSSMVSVFSGMGLSGISIYIIYNLLKKGMTTNLILIIFLAVFTIMYLALNTYLNKTCERDFNNIIV